MTYRISFDDPYIQHLPAHLAGCEHWPALFDLIGEGRFVVAKADHLGRYSDLSIDIEQYALHGAIECKHWRRFVHFAVLAANLRGLSGALAKEEIVSALVRNGRRRLAEDLVNLQTDPLVRAWTRAVMAAEMSPDSYSTRITTIIQTLEQAPPPEDRASARKWADTLNIIIRHYGCSYTAEIARFIQHLEPWPSMSDDVWLAVARSVAGRDDSDLWRILWDVCERIQSRRFRLKHVPLLLALVDPVRIDAAITALHELAVGDSQLFWRGCAALVAETEPFDAPAAGQRWRVIVERYGPVDWTPQLLETGKRLFLTGDKTALHTRLASIADPYSQAAFRVLAVEQGGHSVSATQAWAAITGLPPGPDKIKWQLRLVQAMPSEPQAARRWYLTAIAQVLRTIGYAIPASDLARYLDLIAAVLPKWLPDHCYCVFIAPATTVEVFSAIVKRAATDGLCRLLFDRVSRYAAFVAPTEHEAFGLRQATLMQLTLKLCCRRTDLKYLDKAKQQLLPPELEQLYPKLVLTLAANGAFELAYDVWGRIRNRSTALLTRLRILPHTRAVTTLFGDLNRSLRFEILYAAMADAGAIADELRGLTALLERPHAPADLADKHLANIRDRNSQARAFLDLARHTLAYQRTTYPAHRRDHQLAANLLRHAARLMSTDNALLPAAIPELAALAAAAGPTRAVAEYAEAVDQIVAWDTLDWKQRLPVLQALFERMPTVLFTAADLNRDQMRRRCTLLTGHFADWVKLRLPRSALPPGEKAPDRERYWCSLLEAALAKLPPQVTDALPGNIRDRLNLARDEMTIAPDSPRRSSGENAGLNPCAPMETLMEARGQDRLQPLARAVVGAFTTGGRLAGISAFNEWLRARLCPSWGGENSTLLAESNRLWQGLRSGLVLTGSGYGIPDAGDAPQAPTDRQRMTRLYRQWRFRPRWFWGQTPRKSLSSIGLLVGLASFPALVFVDGALFLRDATPTAGSGTGVSAAFGLPIQILSVMVCLINGWMADRWLTYQTLPGWRAKRWVRCIRFLGGAIPLLGLHVYAAWQWLMQNGHAGLQARFLVPAAVPDKYNDISANALRDWRINLAARLDRLAVSAWRWNFHIWWLVLVNLAVLAMLSGGYLMPLADGPQRWIAITLVCVFRVPLAAGMFYALRVLAQDARLPKTAALLWQVAALLWLVPVPFLPLLGLFLFALLFPKAPREETIIYDAFTYRSDIGRQALWMALEKNLQREWRRSPWWQRLFSRPGNLDKTTRATDARVKRNRIYNLECAVLLGEAVGIGWFLSGLEPQNRFLTGAVEVILGGLVYGSLILAAVGLLAWLAGFIFSVVRASHLLRRWRRKGYLQFFSVSQLALFAGLMSGAAIATRQYEIIWTLMALGGLAAAIVIAGPDLLCMVLPIRERYVRDMSKYVAIMVLCCCVSVVGLNAAGDAQFAADNLDPVTFMLALLPLGNLVSITWIGWLLRPFQLRDLFDRRKPRKARLAIALILATVVLPLGSICIPLWIYINHRLWPAYEAVLPQPGEASPDPD